MPFSAHWAWSLNAPQQHCTLPRRTSSVASCAAYHLTYPRTFSFFRLTRELCLPAPASRPGGTCLRANGHNMPGAGFAVWRQPPATALFAALFSGHVDWTVLAQRTAHQLRSFFGSHSPFFTVWDAADTAEHPYNIHK